MVNQRARNHLIDFSIATFDSYQANWHHEKIAEKLEAIERGEIKRLMLYLPPRHGKSLLATINFPAWYLGRNPNKEVVTASYSGDLAVDFGGKTRDLIQDEVYKNIFNVRLKKDDKGKAKWMTDKKGAYTSVGVGGALTGRGANLLIIDDPIKNREEADSEVIREKVWSWYTSTARTRLEKDASIVIIQTRWHLDDLGGRLLQKMEDGGTEWEVVSFPAIATNEESYRKKGEPLWEDKYDIKALMELKRDVGIYDWEALYQQSPILTENQEFKPEWFGKAERRIIDGSNTRKFLTIDTAMSEKTSADFTGFCENYIDKENMWNLSAYQMKLNPKDLVSYLFTVQEKRNFEKIGIEKTTYTIGLKPFLDEEQRKRGVFLPIVELSHNQTNKETRIRGLIPRYSSYSVNHIDNECKELERQLVTFPRSLHDDVIDATAYQLQIADEWKAEETTSYTPSWVSNRW